MHARRDSAAGIRFLAAVREGRGLKPSARAAGIGKETGYRWLREAFGALRDEGLSVEQAAAELGYCSPLLVDWERQRPGPRGRHHLAVDAGVEDAFWRRFAGGDSIGAATRAAGVGRSTGYRWWRARYGKLREQGLTARAAALRLRIPTPLARQWEDQRRRADEHARRERQALLRRALRTSARHAEELTRRRAPRSDVLARDTRYWELMRAGLSNTAASTILGVHRKTGARIRARRHQQTAPPSRPAERSSRYLSLRERLQIADLLRLDYSIRVIAGELGRYPSTIKRELDRHRDEHGRYLPHHADHVAAQQRRRPRQHKLIAHPRLRTLVQRKLNRCWSPDEISGWLRRTYPTDPTMRLCPETIYRALLVPGGQGLHKRYCRKLRTGRRIRKSRWLTRSGHGAAVRDMTMIDQRPAEVETKQQAGHWEGDLILGVGCASAMMTLRERTTQYGIVINLPVDHTAETVSAAATAAFAPLPAHMKRTLTWDQGVEMARHRELARATGVAIYFAQRCSPWQRGANGLCQGSWTSPRVDHAAAVAAAR
ncbi:IS30 family transposase [Blastococcus sp. CCUG 61487]|uniref:IS30 family transposase n=1 Tax=Blastococcus sp. CCUG 61487 TaxID=1840703 RepID=UPI00201E2A11|nr:IS30 family transposase [Blastococcus sp. CCUG 61487]